MYSIGSARRAGRARRRAGTLLCLGLIVGLGASACGSSGPTGATSSAGCVRVVDKDGKKLAKCLPVAPQNKRLDLSVPAAFSNPTSVTNPLFPASKLIQVIYGGQVDGKPFRTEFTLLPDIKTISWNGRQFKTITWQYLAYSDGRIKEIALDWFAQADDGSVWYFGEDVTDYENGVKVSNAGTWLAGKDGAPPAMIMPVGPKVGDVYRVENLPEVVFEEVTVSSVGQTVPGPNGSVKGAMVVKQLHMDGSYSDKVFAPGYGEFSTGQGGDFEGVSLAVPTDVLAGAPQQLAALSAASRAAFDAVGGNDWARAAAAASALTQAWDAYRAVGIPPTLEKQMSRDIDSLTKAVAARKSTEAREAALRIGQNDTDLRLRHEPVTLVDKARLALWARQLVRDAEAKAAGPVAGDATTLKLIWDRVRHTADQGTATRVDAQLAELRGAADKKDIAAATKAAVALVATFESLGYR